MAAVVDDYLGDELDMLESDSRRGEDGGYLD
jgi:hypothetical protein